MTDDAPRRRGEMSLLDHLGELRAVLLQSIGAITAASVVGWFLSERAIDLLVRPAIRTGVTDLKFLSPGGAFILRVKTAVGVGVFLGAPIVVWRLWSFIVPGLMPHERRLVAPAIVGSLFLFYAGTAFSYFVVLPFTIQFLLGFQTQLLQPMLTADLYFPFVMQEMLAFGAVFQFPLVVAALTYAEILGPDFLRRFWRHGVVLVFVVSAILTPPDVASQLLMAAPTLLLYVLSMGLAQIAAKARRNARERSRA
jgi:sec-independent protein translocase protein TatC